MGIEITGDRELSRDLHYLRDGVGDQHMATREVAEEAARYMARIAPRRSGRLARSIQPTSSRGVAAVTIGAPYAGVINYGWPARHIAAANFIQATDQPLARRAPSLLQRGVDRLIRMAGLA